MDFFLVVWREFENRKSIAKNELIQEESEEIALNKMQIFNSQRRLTTTDYVVINLTTFLAEKQLELKELPKSED